MTNIVLALFQQIVIVTVILSIFFKSMTTQDYKQDNKYRIWTTHICTPFYMMYTNQNTHISATQLVAA